MQDPDSDSIGNILQYKTIAIVGLSDKPTRDSYIVAHYMQQQGYKIIPVNPTVEMVLGEKSFPNLKSIPVPVDVVNLFQRSENVLPHVADAIDIGAKAIWMQLDVVHQQSADMAKAAGAEVVMNKCIKIEHENLFLKD